MARASWRPAMTSPNNTMSPEAIRKGIVVKAAIGMLLMFVLATFLFSGPADPDGQLINRKKFKLGMSTMSDSWVTGADSTAQTLQQQYTRTHTEDGSVEERRLGESDSDASSTEAQTRVGGADPFVPQTDPQTGADPSESPSNALVLASGEQLLEYPNSNSTTPKRVALLVFGLQRSLFLTLPSIIKRVIRPLTDVGYQPTVFVHQFDHVAHDQHSGGEEGAWWSLLKPFAHTVTSQEEFLSTHREQLDACAEHGTGWIYMNPDDQTQSIDNLACQLKSVEQVSNLWEAHYVTHPEEYAAVVYMRPDVQYLSNFPVHLVPQLKEKDLYVPDWANHMGMNDRFALLHPQSAGLWKGRLDHTLEHCLEEPIHSESFAKQFAASSHLEIKKMPVDFVFFRVRPDGSIPDRDYLIPGYEHAKAEIAVRQQEFAEGLVEKPPMDADPPSSTWRQTKGSVAGKARQKHLDSLAKAEGPPADPELPPPPLTADESPKEDIWEAQRDEELAGEEPAATAGGQEPSDAPLLAPTEAPAVAQKDIEPESDSWDNTIAVCTIMKKEKISDVREWLLYHKWLGVDKVYLRENKNTSEISKHYKGPFQDLIDEGFLDIDTWPGQSPQAQQLWYNRCSQSDLAGAQSWILFSDLDEYPMLLNGGVAVEEPDLKAFMKKYRGAAGLTLQWVMFGSSGIRDRPEPGGPLRHFEKCSDKLSFEMKYEEGSNPRDGPSVRYGDGRRKHNVDAKPMVYVREDSKHADVFGLVAPQDSPRCRTYEGHLQEYEYKEDMQAIPQGEALVLFHYMTRSFQDFRENKLSRYAGMYVDDFKERRENATKAGGPVPADEQLFDDLEHDLGIDKEAAVCSTAIDAEYAKRCCEWH